MRANARRRFLPSCVDEYQLEARVVLSQGFAAPAALVLNPVRNRARVLRRSSPQDKVNLAFDRFTNDYLQAQQVYISAATAGLANADTTFKDYTTQRVNLLSQELVKALGRLPGATSKLKPNQRLNQPISTALQSFLFRKINGTTVQGATGSYDNISLLTALTAAVPSSSATNPLPAPAATLFTLKAASAIQAARLNTTNAAFWMSSGAFQHHK